MSASKITYQQRFVSDIITFHPVKKVDDTWRVNLITPLQFQSCPVKFNGEKRVVFNNPDMISFIKSLEMQIINRITENSVVIFGKEKHFSQQELYERMDKLWIQEESGNMTKEINPETKVKCIDNEERALSEIKNNVIILYKIKSITFTKTTWRVDYTVLGIKEHLSRTKPTFKNYFETPVDPIIVEAKAIAETEENESSIKVILPKQFF